MAPKSARAPSKRGTDAAVPSSPPKKAKTGLVVGDTLPEFEVETDQSEQISSKDMVADSGAIIFFYPRANTGGCTTQANGFRDNYDALVAAGYKVYGMSADKPKSQANWKAKQEYQYPLLCDPSFEVLKKLGVAKGDKGIRRSHIVIAKGGKIEQLHYDISPKDSVAEAVKLIGSGEEAGEEAKAAEAEEGAGPEEAEEKEGETSPEEEEGDEEESPPAKKAKGKAKAPAKPASGKAAAKPASGKPAAKPASGKPAAKPASGKAAAKPAAEKATAKPASGKAAAGKADKDSGKAEKDSGKAEKASGKAEKVSGKAASGEGKASGKAAAGKAKGKGK